MDDFLTSEAIAISPEFKVERINTLNLLSKDSKYYGLNRFKMGFAPDIYEYIGEFDLIINYNEYINLQEGNYLAMEFNKKTSK